MDPKVRRLALKMAQAPDPADVESVAGFLYFCPACGSPTLEERYEFLICSVCW
jgi:hypothetical protein